jgi:hypothetical protein
MQQIRAFDAEIVGIGLTAPIPDRGDAAVERSDDGLKESTDNVGAHRCSVVENAGDLVLGFSPALRSLCKIRNLPSPVASRRSCRPDDLRRRSKATAPKG